MTNLFSIFDPIAFLGMPLNWVSCFIALLIIPSSIWLSSTHLSSFFSSGWKSLHSEFTAIFGGSSAPGLSLFPATLLIFVLLNNFMGLFPYVFTASSHLTFTIALALPLWLGHMCLGAMKTPFNMLAHLVPLGTPAGLMPFMVLIETTSSVIRPLTLSVRLAANMVAGHLLLVLLSGQAPSASLALILTLTLALTLLITLEAAVALIQGYVFGVLSSLYLNEINSSRLSTA